MQHEAKSTGVESKPSFALSGLNEDHKEHLKEALHDFVEVENHKKRGRFYWPPEVRQFWGDDQEEMETDWIELFFDLVYVATAFNLGTKLEADISRGDYVEAVLFFFAQFSAMFDVWLSRTMYVARFRVVSTYHKCLDIFEACVVAYMALFIGSAFEIQDSSSDLDESNPIEENTSRYLQETEAEETLEINFLAAFCSCYVLITLIYAARYLELFRTPVEALRDRVKQVRVMAVASSRRQLETFLVASTCVFLSTVGEYKIAVVILMLSPLLGNMFLIFRFQKKQEGDVAVPLHVSFMIRRAGEFKMLMLGEGVLQIIIQEIGAEDTALHLSVFGLSFTLIAIFQVLSYFVLPSEPHDHAFRKSKPRSFLVLVVQQGYFASLIAFGVGVKTVLKNSYKLENADYERFAALLNFSLMVATTTLWILHVLHAGILEILFKEPVRKKLGTGDTSFQEEMDKEDNLNYVRIGANLGLFLLPMLFIVYPLQEDTIDTRVYVLQLFAIVFLICFLFFVDRKTVKNLMPHSDDDFEHDFGDDKSAPISKLASFHVSKFIGLDELGASGKDNLLEFKRDKIVHMLRYAKVEACKLEEKMREATPEEFQDIIQRLEQLSTLHTVAIQSLHRCIPSMQQQKNSAISEVGAEETFEEVRRTSTKHSL